MPCPRCGRIGHNIRTCSRFPPQVPPQNDPPQNDPPQNDPPQFHLRMIHLKFHQNDIDEQVIKNQDMMVIILMIEEELRYLISNNLLDTLDKEKIKFYENMLKLKYKEVDLINLNKNKRLKIYMINSNINYLMNENDIKFIGILEPRTLFKLKSFTGYKYQIYDEYSDFPDEIFIEDTMNDKILLNNIRDSSLDISVPTSKKLTNINENLISTLKLNYLITQLIRLGAMNDENYSCILDLHKDIKIPEHDDLDLEAAGLPNEIFTNN